ncbi:MAG: transferase [Deltaproteobacteria bacterium]|nr:transferase [Deltaproteobacteria bacterium]
MLCQADYDFSEDGDFQRTCEGQPIRELGLGVACYPGVILGRDVTIAPGACLGRPTANTGIRRQPREDGARKTLIGDGCHIGHGVTIYQGAHIGPRCMICDGARIGPGAELEKGVLIAQNVTVNRGAMIGSFTKVMDLAHITGDMRIGERCFIAPGVMSANDNSMGRANPPETRPPIVQDDVRIGLGARILPGVVLGRGCVIGAGAVVTDDTEPGWLYLGVPAHRVREVEMPEVE